MFGVSGTVLDTRRVALTHGNFDSEAEARRHARTLKKDHDALGKLHPTVAKRSRGRMVARIPRPGWRSPPTGCCGFPPRTATRSSCTTSSTATAAPRRAVRTAATAAACTWRSIATASSRWSTSCRRPTCSRGSCGGDLRECPLRRAAGPGRRRPGSARLQGRHASPRRSLPAVLGGPLPGLRGPWQGTPAYDQGGPPDCGGGRHAPRRHPARRHGVLGELRRAYRGQRRGVAEPSDPQLRGRPDPKLGRPSSTGLVKPTCRRGCTMRSTRTASRSPSPARMRTAGRRRSIRPRWREQPGFPRTSGA